MKKFFTLLAATMLSVVGFAAAGPNSGNVQNIPTTADNPFDCSAVIFDQVTYDANWNGNNIDYIGKHDVVSFNINNTKEAAYKITFKYSTILDGVTVDFVIKNASDQEVFKSTINTPSTSGGQDDWSNYVDAESEVTPVLPVGSYKFFIYYGEGTWQGGENPFACNINNIAFIEQAGAAGGASFDVDLSTVDTSESLAGNLHYLNDGSDNTPRLDYPGAGSIGKFEIEIPQKSAYKITFNYASPMDKMFMVWTLTDANGNVVYNEYFPLDPTGAPGDFWTIYKDFDGVPQTPVLEAGKYTLRLYYNVTPEGVITPAWYDGSENKNFHSNITRITFTAVAGGNDVTPQAGKTIYSWVGGEAGATEVGGTAVATDGESVNYANSTYWTIRINKKKADIATDNVTITLDEALAEGDEIAITAYRNKDTNANGTLYMLFENGTEIDEGTDIVWNNIHADYGQQPNTRTFTVAAEAGSKTIQIARSAASTNVFITEIKITRAGAGEPEPANIRVWDFTKWSDATVANLKADAAASALTGWSDVEKQADAEAGNGPTDISKDNAFWFQGEIPADGQLTANGVVIEETKGLIFQSAIGPRRNLAIAVNYPETSLGTYAGPSYLWLGGSGLDYFEIPEVKAGESVYMELESHKPTDARGIKLLQAGTEIDTFTPTTKDSRFWTIPADGNVLIQNTNGCHIYVIKVGAEKDIETSGVKAIETVAERPANNIIYNLRGQRVDASYKGIVIMNGKKYFQK